MSKGEYLGEFELVVLLALARVGNDAYGVSIYEEIQRITRRDTSIPAVYVTLARLEKKGLVSSRVGEPTGDRGGRAKKFFQVEPAGADALKRSRDMLERLWEGVELEATH